jgi:hypothetical protein
MNCPLVRLSIVAAFPTEMSCSRYSSKASYSRTRPSVSAVEMFNATSRSRGSSTATVTVSISYPTTIQPIVSANSLSRPMPTTPPSRAVAHR